MAEYFKKENTHNEGGEATEEEVVVGPAADTVAIVDQGNDSGDSCSSGEIIADVTATDKKKGINKRKDNYRIQVSNTKKPFVFYLNLAKVFYTSMKSSFWFSCFKFCSFLFVKKRFFGRFHALSLSWFYYEQFCLYSFLLSFPILISSIKIRVP